MNSKTRVLGALQGEFVDQRPFTAMLSLYGARLTRCPLQQYYTDPRAFVRGQTAVRETFQPDILFAPLTVVAEGEAFGSQAKYFDDQPPNLVRPAAPFPADIVGLSLPDVNTHPRLIFIREALCQLAAEHGEDVCIGAFALSPVDLPLMMMGMDGWLQTVLFDRDSARRRMLDLTIPFFVQWAQALLKDGAALIVVPTAFVNPWIVSREIAETFSLPVLRQALSQIQGKIILHHTGKAFASFWEMCRDLPNVVGLLVDSRNDFTRVRENAGADIAILGGFDGPRIGRMPFQEIEQAGRDMLREFCQDPRIVPGASALDVGLHTPPESIHALRRALTTAGVA